MSLVQVINESNSLAGRVLRPHLSARSRFLTKCVCSTSQLSKPSRHYHLRQGPFDLPPQYMRVRAFSTTQCLFKKGGKAAREEKQAAGKGNDATSEDPYDFTGLEAEISTAIERLKNDLSKLKAGGRFNSETVENLRVQPSKDNKQTVKVSDLSQVIPKGRIVQILVGEQDHVKPISSAIQASSLSLTPQPDPTGANPLLIVLNIPPPTADSRKAVVVEAGKAGEKAASSIREARGKLQKKLRAMSVNKRARPDDLKKAGDQMEKVVEKGSTELKRIVDNAKKVLESG